MLGSHITRILFLLYLHDEYKSQHNLVEIMVNFICTDDNPTLRNVSRLGDDNFMFAYVLLYASTGLTERNTSCTIDAWSLE